MAAETEVRADTPSAPRRLGWFVPLAVAVLIFALGEGAARIAVWWQYGTAGHQLQESLDYTPFLISGSPDLPARVPAAAKGDAARVLWIGSSTAEQFPRAELEQAFAGALGRRVEVVNLGQGSYNSTQELVLLTLYGLQCQPDIIVTLDGINDIVHATKTGKPGVPYQDLTIEQALNSPTRFWLARLFASSQLVNVVRKAWERRAEVSAQRDAALVDATVRTYRDNVLKMSILAKGIGAGHVAVLQPYLAARPQAPAGERALAQNYAYRTDFMTTVMRRFDRALSAAALPDNGVYVNGLSVFDNQPDTLCFSDEAHLTPDGRRLLLGRIIARLRDAQKTSPGAQKTSPGLGSRDSADGAAVSGKRRYVPRGNSQ